MGFIFQAQLFANRVQVPFRIWASGAHPGYSCRDVSLFQSPGFLNPEPAERPPAFPEFLLGTDAKAASKPSCQQTLWLEQTWKANTRVENTEEAHLFKRRIQMNV
ncbi:unnamed protein product [Natator depressus]